MSPPNAQEHPGDPRTRACEAARHFRLPFRGRVWRGNTGNWSGAGIGSSIDFQDHRPYVAGDDPRYINWQAFARTGAYSMKLYREEVSPRVDVVMDVSASMFHRPAKSARSLELFYFCLESARRTQATVRAWYLCGSECRELLSEAIVAGNLDLPECEGAGNLSLRGVPWRRHALRVLVSDLLDPRGGEEIFPFLGTETASSLVLAPYCREEHAPDWQGNIELIDCETGERRIQFFSADIRKRYRDDYRRHFEMMDDLARHHRTALARLPSEEHLIDALHQHALPPGAVEPWD